MPLSERFTWDLRVRFVDTDASGRIHYTAMFRYFEAAEFEFLRRAGVSYNDFPDHGFPRVHVDCDYKGATQNDDMLTIAVTVAHLGNSSFTYAFQATAAGDGREIAEGKITVVCLSKATGKPVTVPEALRGALV
jgi:YbgC/YbaW family acyl-CoA thioester hydrolase